MATPIRSSTDNFGKTPNEIRTLSFDFTGDLAVSETLLASPAPTLSSSPAGLTFGTPSVGSGLVQATVSGGSDGVAYLVSCSVDTSAGQRLETSGVIYVEQLE